MYLHLEQSHNIGNVAKVEYQSKCQVFKCPYCEESINGSNLSRHKNNCKYFYKFTRKTLTGYECTICSSKLSNRSILHAHLEEIHKISKSEDGPTMRKCKFCLETIELTSIKEHRHNCKNFYQFMRKTPKTYECKFCSTKLTKREEQNRRMLTPSTNGYSAASTLPSLLPLPSSFT